MNNLKQTLESIEVHCYCPFALGGDERIVPLSELLKIAGYLTTAKEISYIDEALQAKKESKHINDAQRMLLEQVHEEIKELYGRVGLEVNRPVAPDHVKVPPAASSHGIQR